MSEGARPLTTREHTVPPNPTLPLEYEPHNGRLAGGLLSGSRLATSAGPDCRIHYRLEVATWRNAQKQECIQNFGESIADIHSNSKGAQGAGSWPGCERATTHSRVGGAPFIPALI